MKVEHLAIWTYNLEGMRSFYMHYFDASSGEVYHNHSREYRSYFLSFDGDCRIELMEMPGVPKSKDNPLKQFTGLIHFALKVGTRDKVNELTETLRKDGYKIISEPRSTGDGYYESVFLDPDGNRVEIMA
ncbi:VOC family protein [uncultured Draconibacterium sp.]|uniref:VOC family protein n=1 Tax=uncultured Draconibacterium sp. TaxID=1573823 RepID=UPI0029BFF47E|nr:VOC family protein [uncultured Draconibacterium sp.]